MLTTLKYIYPHNHQLVLSHASPTLAVWLAGAREDTQEDSVTLSLPDWDSDTVGQFVTSLYQGRLPQGLEARTRLQLLARELGLGLGEVAREDCKEVGRRLQEEEAPAAPLVSSGVPLGSQQVQVVQTDSGEILLVTCEGGQGAGTHLLQGQEQGQGLDDEVERVKAVKIAQIKEQQGKQCPLCYSTAIQHR